MPNQRKRTSRSKTPSAKQKSADDAKKRKKKAAKAEKDLAKALTLTGQSVAVDEDAEIVAAKKDVAAKEDVAVKNEVAAKKDTKPTKIKKEKDLAKASTEESVALEDSDDEVELVPAKKGQKPTKTNTTTRKRVDQCGQLRRRCRF